MPEAATFRRIPEEAHDPLTTEGDDDPSLVPQRVSGDIRGEVIPELTKLSLFIPLSRNPRGVTRSASNLLHRSARTPAHPFLPPPCTLTYLLTPLGCTVRSHTPLHTYDLPSALCQYCPCSFFCGNSGRCLPLDQRSARARILCGWNSKRRNTSDWSVSIGTTRPFLHSIFSILRVSSLASRRREFINAALRTYRPNERRENVALHWKLFVMICKLYAHISDISRSLNDAYNYAISTWILVYARARVRSEVTLTLFGQRFSLLGKRRTRVIRAMNVFPARVIAD